MMLHPIFSDDGMPFTTEKFEHPAMTIDEARAAGLLSPTMAEIAQMLDDNSHGIAGLQEELERRISLDTSHLKSALLANLPTEGVRDGAAAWCDDGRKAGEGGGSGTGVPVYFDEAASGWFSFRTDAAVLV